jgi:hypothetical protein
MKPLEATPAYESAHLVAQDLIARIRELLFKQPHPCDEQQPIGWRDVGRMAQINQRLSTVVEYLETAET